MRCGRKYLESIISSRATFKRSRIIELANDLSSNRVSRTTIAVCAERNLLSRTLRSFLPGLLSLAFFLAQLFAVCGPAHGFTYFTAGGVNPIDIVVHPGKYAFGAGQVTLTVGINASSAHADDMMISVQNAVNQWNWQVAMTGNIETGPANNVPAGMYDFESVMLHELGHSLGLGHANLASESGLSGSDKNYTNSNDGVNNVYDLDPGADGVIGSSDDVRGDDENVNWFDKASNNPFAKPSSGAVIDSTTYSRDLADLPAGHSYSANGDRDVAALLGVANTESVMQQGVSPGEMQRTLSADDVSGIRYGQSGIDELSGTADDYWIDLQFVGQTISADIVIDVANGVTSFAQTNSFVLINLAPTAENHKATYLPKIYFNDANQDWHFNDTLFVPVLGDTDLDGDVDSEDILRAFSNFAGPEITGVTLAMGDVEGGDRDVDVNDILTMFSAFTGPLDTGASRLAPASLGMPAEAGDPNAPDLIYDAATGEVVLDPDGGMIRGYSLMSAGGFLDPNFVAVLGGVSVGNASEISEAVFGEGDAGLMVAASIGNILPAGLDLASLSLLLTEFSASVELGAELEQFDLIVLNSSAPEPATLLLGAIALLGLGFCGARRSRRGVSRR